MVQYIGETGGIPAAAGTGDGNGTGNGSGTGGPSAGAADPSNPSNPGSQGKSKFTAGELTTLLQGYGIPAGYFSDLITQAVQMKWSPEELTAKIYASPEFANMFPGLARPDGSFRMTPAEYLTMKDSYQHAAYTLGYHLSDALLAKQFAGDVSPQELSDKLSAVSMIQSKPGEFAALKKALEDNGMGQITPEHLVQFALGQAPKQWYDIVENTLIRSTAKNFGAPLGSKMVGEIMKQAGPVTDLAGAQAVGGKVEEVANWIRTTLPLSQVYGFGLTRSDLIAAEFGGPGAAVAKEKVQRVNDTNTEFHDVRRAHMAAQASQGGLATLGGQQDQAQVA